MRHVPVTLLVALGLCGTAQAAAPGINGDVVTVGTTSGQTTVYAFTPEGEGPTGIAGPFSSGAMLNDFSEVSPDGTRAIVNPSGELRVLDLTDTQPGDPLATGTVPNCGEWSPDGTRIAFVDGETAGGSRLRIVDADGGVPATVMDFAPDATNNTVNMALCPTWAPDGEELVFVRSVGRCSGTNCSSYAQGEHLQAVGTDGDGLRDISPLALVVETDEDEEPPDRIDLYSPDVAGDGSLVAVSAAHTQVNQGEIQVVPLSGGTLTKVAGGVASVVGYYALTPAFSPDGQRIVYSSVAGSGLTLRTVDFDGTDDRPFADAQPAAADFEPQWLPALVPVGIGSGPPELTNSTSAAFQFSASDPPAGHFECRLDSESFSECTSPKSYSGLSEGSHTFRVRYAPDEGAPGTPASRTWTIDTTPPTTTVDSAPSGEDNPPDVTIAFHASEAGSSFSCQLDGGAPTPCTSPVSLTGLAGGPHELLIRATDPAGNQQATAQAVRWTVRGDRVDAVAECPAGTLAKVEFGPIVAIAPTEDACFGTEEIDNRQVRVSRGTVFVNGIKLTPQSGARIAVDGVLGGGSVRSIGGEAKVEFGKLSWTDDVAFDSIDSTTGGRVAARVSGIAASFFEQRIVGLPTFEFSADNGGQTALGFSIELPEAFTALPATDTEEAEDGKISASFTATASNNLGVFFAGKATVSDLWLRGKVKLKNLTLGVDQGKGTFEGSVGLALAKGAVKPPGIGEDAVLTASVSIGPDGMLGGLRSLTLDASNLGVHLGYGFFFQRVGGGVERLANALKWAFTGGASWGPKLKIEVSGVELFDGEAVSLDGAYTLTVPDGEGPVVVGATGQGKVVDIPFANGAVTYSNPGGINLTGTYDYTFTGYGFVATINRAWFDPSTDDFSIEASGESRLPGPADLLLNDSAEVVLSKTGFAACIGEAGEKVGFTRVWGQDFDLWTDSCDVGPFRRGSAAAAQAGGVRTIDVPERARITVIEAIGAGAAPELTLRDPDGAAVDGQRIADPRRATTTIVLTRPAAGTWTLEPQPGSAITDVQVADGLPPLKVSARVRGRGAKRTLSWKARGLKGHRLMLVERGRGGSAKRLVETARAKGRKRFSPSPFVAGTSRRIEAVVTRRGLVRRTLVAARFQGAAAKVGKARKLKRRGKTLSWKRARGASGYSVALELRRGLGLAFETRKPRLTLPAAARKGRLRATVVATGSAARVGRAVSKRFK